MLRDDNDARKESVRNIAALAAFTLAMKRGLHELSDRERIDVQEALNLPVGEFVALIVGALLTLAFFLGPPALATDATDMVRTAAASLSGAVAHLGDRPEAQAAEHVAPAQP